MQHGTLDILHTRHMTGKKLVGKDGKKKNIYILNQEIGISKKKRDVKESYFPTINVVVV